MNTISILIILIILSDIGYILTNSYHYDIVSGVPKTLQYPSAGHNYFFVLPLKKNDKGFITLTHNKVASFFELLKKHEFSSYSQNSWSSTNSDLLKNKDYTKKIIDDKVVTSISFSIKYSDTRYFGIELKVPSNLKYLTIYLIIGKNAYNISIDSLYIFHSLVSGIPYFFYINATTKQNITININTDCTTNKFLDELNIYEYYNKDEKENILSRKSVEFIKSGNQIDLNLTYIVSHYNTKYVAFEVMPYYDLDYIKLTIKNNSVTSSSSSNDKTSTDTLYLIIASSIILIVVITIIGIIICKKKRKNKINNLDSNSQQPLYPQNN